MCRLEPTRDGRARTISVSCGILRVWDAPTDHLRTALATDGPIFPCAADDRPHAAHLASCCRGQHHRKIAPYPAAAPHWATGWPARLAGCFSAIPWPASLAGQRPATAWRRASGRGGPKSAGRKVFSLIRAEKRVEKCEISTRRVEMCRVEISSLIFGVTAEGRSLTLHGILIPRPRTTLSSRCGLSLARATRA